MATTVTLSNATTGTVLHLVNSTGRAVAGGDPMNAATTPFSVRAGWEPKAAEPKTLFAGGGPWGMGAMPVWTSYGNVEDDPIPLIYEGTAFTDVASAVQQINQMFAPLYGAPCVLSMTPRGSSNPVHFDLYLGYAQPASFEGTQRNPYEGATTIFVDVPIVRSPFGGSETLATLINGVSIGNTGTGTPDNLESLGAVPGDLAYEGQPLNVRFHKPTTSTAATVLLSTVYSRAYDATSSSVTTTTSGTFTTSGAVTLTQLRLKRGLNVRVVGRVTTLTAPTKQEYKVELFAGGSGVAWASEWVGLPGSSTTAQLVDFGGAPLDMMRVPLTTSPTVTVRVSLRSTDGTSVAATLGYVEVLLYHDFAKVSTGGLSSGQRLHLFGAQNLSGGGWLPNLEKRGIVSSSADIPQASATVYGGCIPRAFAGASLWVAWWDSDGGHTASDTATLYCWCASLWRGLKG